MIADIVAFDGYHVVHAEELVRKDEIRKPDRPESDVRHAFEVQVVLKNLTPANTVFR